MCGRYYVDSEDQTEELQAIIAEVQRRSKEQLQLGEIYPSATAPVIANNRVGRPVPFAMHWGFRLNGALVINARSETAADKPLFRDGMAHRRCLIPASCYYEWEKQGDRKVKYAVGKGKMVYMAGVYRIEEEGPSFSILTRQSAENIAFIHDRMPVILPTETRDLWLNGIQSVDELFRCAVLDVQFRTA